MWVSPTWKLSLTPIEMDGMSAVMKIDGRNKIYSMTMMKSAFTARYYLAKRLSAFVSAGCMYSRVTKISNRKFSEMYKNLFSSSGKMHYAPAFRFAVGFSYGI